MIEKSTEDAKKVTLSFSDAESERNKREKNFIIHGVLKVAESQNNIVYDQDYVKSLFRILGLTIEPSSISWNDYREQ